MLARAIPATPASHMNFLRVIDPFTALSSGCRQTVVEGLRFRSACLVFVPAMSSYPKAGHRPTRPVALLEKVEIGSLFRTPLLLLPLPKFLAGDRTIHFACLYDPLQ